MPSRTVQVRMALRTPEGTFIEPLVSRTISVERVGDEEAADPLSKAGLFDGRLRYVVKGFGINEAYFASLDEIYALFGSSCPKIQLDYNGNRHLMAILDEMGFEQPRAYFV